MRELFLHVGMHKTGTSSIQQSLQAHRALLLEHGYAWFEADAPNHSRAVFSAFTDAPHRYHMNRRHGLHRAEDATAYGAACRDALARFLAEAPASRLVLSGESIGMLRPEAKQRMLEAFRPAVDRITVIGFVRPPRSFVASAIEQLIHGGQTLDQIRGAQMAPRYRERFAQFLAAPEVAATRLQLYTPDALDHGCSVATFLRLIGAPASLYPQIAVPRANAGRSHLGRVLALAANEAVPVFQADGSTNPERAIGLTPFLDRLAGPRFRVPETLIAAGLADSAEDIAWMEQQLGAAFADSEKAARADAGAGAIRPLEPAEIGSLAVALNGLLLQLDQARAARRGAAGRVSSDRAEAASGGAPNGPAELARHPPPPTAALDERRAARRAERRRFRLEQP